MTGHDVNVTDFLEAVGKNEDKGEDRDAHLPEEDLGLEVVVEEDSVEVRQSTFRKNSVTRARSMPVKRLWMSMHVIRVHQACQRKLIQYTTKYWWRKTIRRRTRGLAPHHRITLAAMGEFH